jgi:hypothetical protein
VFTLVEIAEATAMDPNTVESAMDLLAAADWPETAGLQVARQDCEYGELQWAVRREQT